MTHYKRNRGSKGGKDRGHAQQGDKEAISHHKRGALTVRSAARDGVGTRGLRGVRGLASSAQIWAFVTALMLSATTGFAAEKRTVKSLLEIRQDRVVVQKWDLSCGAAALATLLNYQHGDPVSEKEIAKTLVQREEYLADPRLVQIRQGFSLLDLKRYVDQRGYEGIGYGQLTLEDLIEHAPIMVPVKFNGYSHFIVFRGIRGDRVLMADPAWGNRTMQVEKFEDAWLEYPGFGRVGFIVARRDGIKPLNRLTPHAREFVMWR